MKNLFDKCRQYATWHSLVLVTLVWIGYELHTINKQMPTDESIGHEMRPFLLALEEVNTKVADISNELGEIANQLRWGRR